MRFLFVVLLLCAAAHAEWTVAGYVGAAHTQNSPLFFHRGAGNGFVVWDVPFRGESFGGPLYYGVRGGYFFGSRFGLEAEFIHLKLFANTDQRVRLQGSVGGVSVNTTEPMNAVVQRFSISHGLNLLLFSFVTRHHLLRKSGEKHGRLMITTRVGAGPTRAHPETQIGGQTLERYEPLARVAVQTGAGPEFRLWNGLHLLGEYKFTITHQRVAVPNGDAQGLFLSHHGVVGLSWHF